MSLDAKSSEWKMKSDRILQRFKILIDYQGEREAFRAETWQSLPQPSNEG